MATPWELGQGERSGVKEPNPREEISCISQRGYYFFLFWRQATLPRPHSHLTPQEAPEEPGGWNSGTGSCGKTKGWKCCLQGQREGRETVEKSPTHKMGEKWPCSPDWVARSVFLGGLWKCVSWKMPVAVLVNTLVLQRKMRWKMKNRQLL